MKRSQKDQKIRDQILVLYHRARQQMEDGRFTGDVGYLYNGIGATHALEAVMVAMGWSAAEIITERCLSPRQELLHPPDEAI